jgi:hypothetical protein
LPRRELTRAPTLERAPAAAQLQAGASWNALALSVDGRTRNIAREQAGRLPALLDRLQASPGAASAWQGADAIRLQLRSGDAPFAMLEIGSTQARWTTAAGAVTVFEPAPALLDALRQEIARLSAR